MGRAPVARIPFDIVSFDLYGASEGLPVSNRGHTCIISVIDHFSGFTFAKALKNQGAYATNKALAKLFLKFGIPNKVISDNGSNFVSKVTKDLMSFLNIEKLVTSPYHPQANGKIENRHKIFSNVLSIYKKENRNDWDQFLPDLTNIINTAYSETTKDNPFYSLFGRDFRIPYDEIIQSPQYYNKTEDYKQECINRMRKTYKIVRQELENVNKPRAKKPTQSQGEHRF
jgi:transposase InsO family protein